MPGGIYILDHLHVLEGFAAAVPSSANPLYISLKNAKAVGILVHTVNGASGATGCAVTLNQALVVAGTNAKALQINEYFSVADVVTADAPWVKSTAVSNTFTTSNTASKHNYYFIPVDPSWLDVSNGFHALQVGLANSTNTTVDVTYFVQPKFSGNPTTFAPMNVD